MPESFREAVVTHMVKVHISVGTFSAEFEHKLRRSNYVTPKNYLDFINTYLKLLEEKDKFIQSQVSEPDMCSLVVSINSVIQCKVLVS